MLETQAIRVRLGLRLTSKQESIPGMSFFRDSAACLLRPHDVHVWSLRLDLARSEQDRLEASLSTDEAARARRFAHAIDRTRFVCAHGLLRLVLSGYTGAQPWELMFQGAPGSRPRLADHQGPRFSLTHSGSLGLVAVNAAREVGVDLEEIREIGDFEHLAATCFSAVERAALAAVPASRRRAAFFAGWTRKEALLKALGEGLSRPLGSFDVTLTPGEPARVLRFAGAPDVPRRYTLHSLHPAAGFVGALAVEGRAVTLRWRPWETTSAVLEEAWAPPDAVESTDLLPAGEGQP